MTEILKFRRLHENVELPSFATEGSAAFDIRAFFEDKINIKFWNKHKEDAYLLNVIDDRFVMIPGHARCLIPTGLISDIPDGYHVKIYPRSGLSLKQGLTLTNSVGIIDSDYVEPWFITLYNNTSMVRQVFSGERLAQGMLVKNETYNITDALEPISRKTSRTGGFGSTGKT